MNMELREASTGQASPDGQEMQPMIGQSDVMPPRPSDNRSAASTLKLVSTLCEALHLEGVTYCHWKSNDALSRSRTGENDLDLLILKEHAARFIQVLCSLGFKQTLSPPDQAMPGVLDFYGYDEESERIVHVHAHFRLVVGDDRAKNYRLPIEPAYLSQTSQDICFPTPRPELEFVVFVIRMMLKHCSWDAILAGKGRLKPAVHAEFAYLRARVDPAAVNDALKNNLPRLTESLMAKCLQSLEPGASLWYRIRTARQLQQVLDADTRRSYPANVAVKTWNGLARICRRRLKRRKARRRLATGGAIIAVVGGDGAGKSTTVQSVDQWLASVLATQRCHLGKPRKSLANGLLARLLKIQRWCGYRPRLRADAEGPADFPGYLVLLREVFRARDRYRVYVKARRFANRGGIVVCDRFPTPQINRMDHSRIRALTQNQPVGRLVNWLRRIEESYYQAIGLPEILIILKLDPEIAVQRRTDEDSDFVRRRSTEIWQLDQSQLDAHFVDASQEKQQMLAGIRQLIWSKI